jgi:hypothetical protein
MPPKHILDPQRKAREPSITINAIRASIGLLPLKARVKSTSSPMSSKSSKYINSPAQQSSKSKSPAKKKQITKTSSNTQSRYPLFEEKLTFSQLPSELQNKMYRKAFYQDEYVLRKWLKPYDDKLRLNELSRNPNAISFVDKAFKLDPDNKDIDWYELSGNKNAIELIKKKLKYEKKQDLKKLNIDEQINWPRLSYNHNAIELLEQRIKEEKLHPERFYNLPKQQTVDWDYVSYNPNAIELLKANRDEITPYIFDNTNLDQAFIKSILDENLVHINWNTIWTKPLFFRLLLNKYPEKLDYDQLSKNTSYKAIELLKAKIIEEKELIEKNPTVYEKLHFSKKVNWRHLSGNPKAIQILTAKALEEKTLRKENPSKYDNLLCKIDWNVLSNNPKAISLLAEKAMEEKALRDTNPKSYESLDPDLKINWNAVSGNIKAISLLAEKAIEEKELRYTNLEYYKSLPFSLKINWYVLSANPRAISLLEKYQEYIDLSGLCQNPNAVKLIKKYIEGFTEQHWSFLALNPCIFYETSN